MMRDEVDYRPQYLWRKATSRQRGRVILVESLDGLPKPSRPCQGEGIAPGFAIDQRPADDHDGGGNVPRQRMLVGQPRFPKGTPGKLAIGQEGRHGQGRTTVCRVASRCHATRFVVDTLYGFDAVHPAIDQGKHCRRRWPSVERPITPPRQVAGEDILGVESPSIRKALGEANRHADRTTVAVSRRQSQQHTTDSVPGLAHQPGSRRDFYRSPNGVIELPLIQNSYP